MNKSKEKTTMKLATYMISWASLVLLIMAAQIIVAKDLGKLLRLLPIAILILGFALVIHLKNKVKHDK